MAKQWQEMGKKQRILARERTRTSPSPSVCRHRRNDLAQSSPLPLYVELIHTDTKTEEQMAIEVRHCHRVSTTNSARARPIRVIDLIGLTAFTSP